MIKNTDAPLYSLSFCLYSFSLVCSLSSHLAYMVVVYRIQLTFTAEQVLYYIQSFFTSNSFIVNIAMASSKAASYSSQYLTIINSVCYIMTDNLMSPSSDFAQQLSLYLCYLPNLRLISSFTESTRPLFSVKADRRFRTNFSKKQLL